MTLSVAEKQEVNSYELFIGALSVISIINIVLALVIFDPAVRNVVIIVDTGLCFVFFADFSGTLRNAESKREILLPPVGLARSARQSAVPRPAHRPRLPRRPCRSAGARCGDENAHQ